MGAQRALVVLVYIFITLNRCMQRMLSPPQGTGHVKVGAGHRIGHTTRATLHARSEYGRTSGLPPPAASATTGSRILTHEGSLSPACPGMPPDSEAKSTLLARCEVVVHSAGDPPLLGACGRCSVRTNLARMSIVEETEALGSILHETTRTRIYQPLNVHWTGVPACYGQ
jgi:hypothetical protein